MARKKRTLVGFIFPAAFLLLLAAGGEQHDTVNGLPVFSRLLKADEVKGRVFSYYFEDHDGNLHRMRVGGDTSTLPQRDTSFRHHPIYDKMVKLKVAPGHWMVYYYRTSQGDLVRVVFSRPLPKKNRDKENQQ